MTSIFPWQRAWLGYIWPASGNLCNEGQRVAPYSLCQSLGLFMEYSTNYCCQKQLHSFHSSSQIRCKYVFVVVGLLWPYLNMSILKAWGSGSRAQRPLTTDIVRRQFPSLRDTTWRNNGGSAWNGSRFEHICAFYVEITNITVSASGFDFLFRTRPRALGQQTPPEPVLIPLTYHSWTD